MKARTTSNPFLRFASLGLTAIAVMTCSPQSVQAANLTWDVTTGDGSTITPGSGTWDTVAGNLKWNNATTNIVWAAANVGIFGGTDGTYAIALGSSFSAQAITFNNSGYTLGATSAQTLSLTNASGNLVTVAAGKSATLGNNVTVALNANAATSTTATAGNDSTLNIDSGATLTKNGAGGTGQLQFTTTTASTNGIVNVAGTVKYEVTSGTAAIVIGQTSGTTTMNVNSGGLLTTNSTGAAATSGSIILANNGATAVLNVASGGAVTISNTGTNSGLNIARLAGGVGTVNFNGGTITTPRVFKGTIGVTGTSSGTFNFNGGTLTANVTNNSDFMTALTRANVRDGGAKIDTGSFNITIAQALLHSNIITNNPVTGTPDAATDGGLTKSGSGVLTLSGANTYTGGTAVNNGTLSLTGSLTSAINVANGATITGTGSTTGSLTMSGGSTFAANTSGSALTANGVTFSGPTSLIFNGATTNGSTYDLFTYGAGGVTGLANLSSTFRTTFNDTGTKITGTVSTGTRTWNTTSGVWEIGGAGTNWSEGDQKYFNGDTVIFGNPAAASTITINGTLLPAGEVTVDNTNAYIFSGSGSIGGGAGLTKTGTGDLTISNANTYTGATTVKNGTLVLSTTGSLASSGSLILGDGTTNTSGIFQLGNAGGAASATLASIAVAGTGTGNAVVGGNAGVSTLTINSASNVTFAGILGGAGTNQNNLGLTKSGAGILILSNTANSYTGQTIISGTGSSGTVQIGANEVIPDASEVVISNGGKFVIGLDTPGNYTETIKGLSGAASAASLVQAFDAGTGGTGITGNLIINTAGGTFDFGGFVRDRGGSIMTLTKSGAGTQILSGANSYSGLTTISGGTLQIGNGGTTGSLASTTAITNNATLAFNRSNALAFNNVISGTGDVTQIGAGTTTLGGVSDYTGATTIVGGTIALTATGTIDATSGVSLGTSGTFDVSSKGGAGYTVSKLTGSGNVVGSLTVSTQLAIGNSPGTVNFGGNLTLGAASTVATDITSGAAPTIGSADLGNVAGNLTITAGSILDLVQLGTYTIGNKFTLFGYTGTLAGNFQDVSNTVLNDGDIFNDAGGAWVIDYNDVSPGANGGTGSNFVTITAVPEAGPAALLGGLGVLALLRRRRAH
ncbi:MAG: autotransporter-associated beta strand repeat-containing protein [Luteolibacter sp.]|uniref:beta strand repeat-containing protein n=1 Tax=Luteolibacter sp. TaxID=1962973 RepID=UPI003266F5EA